MSDKHNKDEMSDSRPGGITEEGFNIDGETVATNSPECVCYKRTWDTGGAYFLKRGQFGHNVGMIYNPRLPTHNPESLRNFRAAKGKFEFDFVKCSKNSFEYYLLFCQTKNEAFYRNAERN